jgi:hypothetical protein
MGKFATLFLLIFFANTLYGHSMCMLSIEKGVVYTENYNLNHLLKATCSASANNSNKTQPVYGSGQFLSHLHVQLARYTIPENLKTSVIAATFSNIDSLSAYPAFFASLHEIFFQKQLVFFKQLIFLFTPLSQSSVLRI